MTPDEIHALAHRIAYESARSDIECFCHVINDPMVVAVNTLPVSVGHRWYDLGTQFTDDFDRVSVALAADYLAARGLLLRQPSSPRLVQILPAPPHDALMPVSLDEALRA
ncbi:hypothetical protein [Rhodanobacter lindaniclasticus]